MNVHINVGLEGRYRFTVRDGKTLRVKRRTHWIKNIITNIGMDRIGVSFIATACQVGSGSTPPAITQTALATYIAGTTAVQGTSTSSQASAPYYSRTVRTWRFAAGVAAGTLAEVGVGWTSTTGNLFSRALILDANGAPTTILVLADEVLDVTYELRVYPPLVDKVFQATINGILHDCVMRAELVTDPNKWVGDSSRRVFDNGLMIGPTTSTGSVYNGTLGAITGSPSGTIAFGSNAVETAYVPGTYEQRGTWSYGLTQGNVAGGVSAAIAESNLGSYQISFSPPIAKDGTKTMTLAYIFSWSRYNP
jgi:hypothetical protein